MSQGTPEKPQLVDAAELPAGGRPRRRRWLRPGLLIAGPAVVLAVAGYVYLTGGRYVETENAYVKADKVMVAAEVSGLISQVAVAENQAVKKGDVLFRIDDRPYRIALAQADAALAKARDDIAQAKAAYAEKQEDLAMAGTDVDFAEKEYTRQSKLVRTNATSASKYDAAEHALESARRRIKVVQQEMAQIRAQLGGDPETPVDRVPAYQAALAARDRAALDLERTVVTAPFDGIAGNTPQVGQQVIGAAAFSNPVMSLVATRDVWIEANFKETDLTNVRPGQPVTIRVDTYPGREWRGKVRSLSQATGAEFSVIPAQNATGNWVKVVQRIPVRITVAGQAGGPDLRIGMSAEVEIDTGSRHRLSGVMYDLFAWTGLTAPAAAAEPAPAS